MKACLSAALVLGAVALAGCTVHQAEAPGLTGPSGLALTIQVTASPDSISQDGGSQSSIQVTAIGPDGRPKAALPLRMDMFVGGVGQDYGTLSGRTIVTNSSGVASVVYTAPPSPTAGIFGTCKGLPGNCVEIVATATGSGFETAAPEGVTIRLVPPGVIQPPAGAPTAAFSFSPIPAAANVPLIFDASASQVGSGASQIVSYNWTFGDGSSGTGKTVQHTFTKAGSYNVTLTVTNDRTLSNPTTQAVTVGAGTAPTVDFVFSPTAPVVNQSVNFDATQARAGAGHSIASYSWSFGDGSTKTGITTTHDFGSAGTFNVLLTVTDEAGQATTVAKPITVATGGGAGGGGATTASFVASPTAPVVGQVVFFNASASTAATGHTLTKYAWDFGDGTTFAGSTSSATHTFTTVGTFTVGLIVTDDTGQIAKFAGTITVAAAGANAPSAKFTSSPTAPVVNQQVVFDASTSTAATGLTITDYAWVFGDGTPIIHTTSKTVAHSYAFANTFSVSLTVTDNIGGTNAVSATVIVAGGALPNANFTFSPAVGVAGSNVSFTSTSTVSAPATTIVSYTWNFGDGSALDNTSGASVNHSFAAGTYSVTLTITDDLGRTGTISKAIVVQ
jgi:PKD repeat protein